MIVGNRSIIIPTSLFFKTCHARAGNGLIQCTRWYNAGTMLVQFLVCLYIVGRTDTGMICCAIGFIIAVIISLATWMRTAVPRYFSGGAGITGGKLEPYQQMQNDVAQKYRKFKKKPKKTPFNDYCYPKSFNVQPQQAFAGEYMKPGSGHHEMLVYHKIGAGKTCLSIQVAEHWTSRGKPLMVMPASLIPGFRAELRSNCAGTKYISEEERAALRDAAPGSSEYRRIIEISDKRIDRVYNIYSYNAFATIMASKNAAACVAPIIIIDEIQNVDNANGVFYKCILDWINMHKRASVLVMSGTPVFDSPEELTNIARLLRIPVPADTETLDPADIPSLFAGKVSYYEGAPAYTFPKANVKIVRCHMSAFQAKWYRSEVAAERSKQGALKFKRVANEFYIKSRQRSNVVFPNGTVGAAGLAELTPALIKSSLATYSCKYAAMMHRLRRGKLSFIYTSFTGPYGITSLKRVLHAHGYVDMATDGPGPRRYAIFSGEETLKEKDKLRAVFNRAENDDGSQLQIVIGSPAIKEGISLLRVRQLHCMEMYWNHSRLAQIFGRAVRYCSHKSLPRDERDVSIYLYAAVDKRARSHAKRTSKNVISKGSGVGAAKFAYTPEESVDLYMLNIADEKRDIAEPYVAALVACAVDRKLHNP